MEIRIHAVSPESILGVAAGAGAASVDAVDGASTVPVTGAGVVVAATVVVSAVGADAAFSAHAAEPPKSAPDRLSAKSIFFIRIPQPQFL